MKRMKNVKNMKSAKGLLSLFIILLDRVRCCPFWILILQDCSIVHSSRYRNKIDNTARRYRDKIDNTARRYRDKIDTMQPGDIVTGSIRTTRVTQTAGTRMDMCARTETNSKTACFSTRDTANTNLLISWTLSNDACIVRVSDKTLLTLRERISPSKGWIPDHYLALSDSSTDVFTFKIHSLALNTEKPMSRQGEENRQETKDKICLHCPAKNTLATAGKQNHPAVPVPHTNRGRVCSTTKKLCTSKRVQNGKLWQHKDVHGSVSSCSLSLCECNQNLLPRMCTTCLQIDFASHWTLYNIVFHGMRFSAHRHDETFFELVVFCRYFLSSQD